jgi:hypothetical protein
LSATPDNTQPTPTGFTWTQLGPVSAFTACNGETYFGDVIVPPFYYMYIQVRDIATTSLYSVVTNLTDVCTGFAQSTGFTNGVWNAGGIGNYTFKLKVTDPITTAPAP